MAALTYKGSVVGASSTTGDAVGYDNTDSGLQATDVQDAIDEIVDGLGSASSKDVASSGDASASQVVLGNDTRLSDARNAADVYDWAKASTKPSYTANEVGAISSTLKGAASGVAELDANGKVPSAQLPSYVDDVIEGYLYDGHFYKESTHTTEIAGETGKIYVDLTTEKTYRWSGSAFVEISESLALGETSSTAYAGDKGKANADAITAIKDGTTIDSFGDVEGAISTLQSNFQGGVDSVYDAIVARGTTPASKSLSDVVTGIGNIETTHTTTYKPTTRASNVDMGQTHSYRYVNTTEVPNSNSGTYSPTTKSTFDLGATNTYRFVNTTGVVNVNSGTYAVTSNGVKDMGADNTQRYVNVSVPNTNTGTYTPTTKSTFDMGATNEYRYVNTTGVANVNSGTYTFAEGSHGSIKDMGATNDKRYVVATNVYNQGKADGKADHSATYKPTARATNNDMGQTHSYRYVDTTSVPNTNSGTYTPAGNAIYDMGATNTNRYCDGRTAYSAGYSAKRAELTGTYAPTSRASNLDMGSNHSYRYVNTNGVPNSNSGTYTPAGNAIYDMGATNDKRYCDGRTAYSAGYSAKRAELTATYKPTSRATGLDMGSNHTYRYVNTTSVPNTNSGTYSPTSNGVKDMGADNTYRYVNVSVANSNSGTYTPTTKSTFDMGATNDKRYVDTRSVANVNSGTYSATSNGVKDMGADNTQRYVNVNVANSNSGTASYDSNGIKDMGATNSYRYVNINVPHPTHTTTYTPTSRASNLDMGSVHSYRYVNTNSVPNSNSGTYTPAGNAIYDMGSTNDKRYCDGRTAYTAGYNAKVAALTGTYTPTSRASNLDMGSNHTYRYVNTNSVPNSNSGTYGSVTSNGVKDMGATNSYRYCNINVPNSNSGTYTYASGSTGGTVDMGSTNSYRYVNATNVYNKGKADGSSSAVTNPNYVQITFATGAGAYYMSSGYVLTKYTGYLKTNTGTVTDAKSYYCALAKGYDYLFTFLPVDQAGVSPVSSSHLANCTIKSDDTNVSVGSFSALYSTQAGATGANIIYCTVSLKNVATNNATLKIFIQASASSKDIYYTVQRL